MSAIRYTLSNRHPPFVESYMDIPDVTAERAIELARPISEAEAENVDWKDWKQRAHPWHRSPMSHEKCKEVELYKQQACFKIDPQIRRGEFLERIRKETLAFEEQEKAIHEATLYSFAHRIWYRGIDETRRKTVPAYCFDNFSKLPTEIQFSIWSFASRFGRPQRHKILPMCCDGIYGCDCYDGNANDHIRQMLDHSSRVEGDQSYDRSYDYGRLTPRAVPAILHVCRDSRNIARKVYTRMPVALQPGYKVREEREAYFNTLFDDFYIGGQYWLHTKLLVDIVIKLWSEQPHRAEVLKRMSGYLEIRNLTVEFSVFLGTPPQVWTAFTKLEQLRICFSPAGYIPEENGHEWIGDPTQYFSLPKPDSTASKHADWIISAATKSLSSLSSDKVADWKIPSISAVICRDEEEDSDDEYDDDSEDDSDDEDWYTEAKAEMDATLSSAQIRKLVNRYNPKRATRRSSRRRS